MGTGIDSTSTVLHGAIAGGTGLVLSQPDHTTQIISLVTQVIALVLLIFKSRKTKNSEQ